MQLISVVENLVEILGPLHLKIEADEAVDYHLQKAKARSYLTQPPSEFLAASRVRERGRKEVAFEKASLVF